MELELSKREDLSQISFKEATTYNPSQAGGIPVRSIDSGRFKTIMYTLVDDW